MKTTALLRWCAFSILFGLMAPAQAADIDIYSDNPRTTDVPNVLIVLDNAANFSSNAGTCTYDDDGTAPSLNGTAGGIEQCAIYNVVNSLPDGAINIGLMVFDSNGITDWDGNNCGSANGGCLAVPLTNMTTDLKVKFLKWVRSWKTSAAGAGTYWIKANGSATAGAMQESWAYYAGKVGLSGRDYSAIQPPAGCQKNFLIYIGNAFTTSGTPGDGGTASPAMALQAAPGVTPEQLTNITIPAANYGTASFSCGYYTMGNHTDSSGLYTDEWARYMKQSDLYGSLEDAQGITTYTIGLLGPTCKPDYPALLTSAAWQGGGKYFGTSDYNEVSVAILKILNEVQAVNSVFASASLPVSVNAQGTYLNQIFLGMFRPDASGDPRWLGNLKQYQFILEYLDPNIPDPNTATLRLGDATGAPALSSAGTGFITPTAISFWTKKNTSVAPDSTGGFFSNDARGAGLGYDSPDGELVEKGGVAQTLRSDILTVNYQTSPAAPRRLYTYCPTAALADGTMDFAAATCNPALTDLSNQFATTNTELTDARLQSVGKIAVSYIQKRYDLVTGLPYALVVTLQPHNYTSGTSVTIKGSDWPEYNGNHDNIKVLNQSAFSFPIVENPPSPAQGVYGGSVDSATAQTVPTLTRAGSTANVHLPSHGYVHGEVLTISGADQPRYNGSFLITVPTVAATGLPDPDNFSYQVVEGPPAIAGSGFATVGNTKVPICPFNGVNPCAVGVSRSGLTVTVNTDGNHGFATGNSVTMSGISDSTGALIAEYNIGPVQLTRIGPKTFTFAIAATTPVSPATGAIKVDRGALVFDILSITRAGGTATATSLVDLTAPGKLAPGLPVNISAVKLGTNEAPYVGTFPVQSVQQKLDGSGLVIGSTFTYPITTNPRTTYVTGMEVWQSGVSDRLSLINWVRGENNFGDEPNPGFGYTARQSVHGDVLHSRPAVVNYGDTRGLVVFYGANDGVFRAVNGSQADAISGVPPGGELWGLILPEHYAGLNRQRVNAPELKMPLTALPGARPKDYFVDGAPGTYQLLKADGTIDKAYLYLGMRRGGRFFYAIDVTDPLQPKVMWRMSSSTPGFAELAQSWSRPRLTLVKGYANPVLIFGAGYDAGAEDLEPPAASTMGRGLFVVDAVTGALVWRATSSADTSTCPAGASCLSVTGMNRSIPAEISFVDRDNDGVIDRLYAADVGGTVWRVDLEPGSLSAPSNWAVSKLAELGCNAGACAAGTTPRKFFYPPNVVPVGVTGGLDSYDVVLLGSGDREHPLTDPVNPQSAYNVQNRFYALKDTRTGMDASVNITGYPITEASLFNATTTPYNNTGSGFYVSLLGVDSTGVAHKGEKSVNASVTVRGTTFFGTNTPVPPAANTCGSNLGLAKGYALDPFTGKSTFTVYDGGGMPPSPVAGVVGIKTADGKTVNQAFCVGCGGIQGLVGGDTGSALGAGDLSKKVPKKPRRTYWYKR